MPGTTDWKNQIDRQIHCLKIYLIYYIFFQKRSPAGLLVLENIRSPFSSLLTNREMLHYQCSPGHLFAILTLDSSAAKNTV